MDSNETERTSRYIIARFDRTPEDETNGTDESIPNGTDESNRRMKQTTACRSNFGGSRSSTVIIDVKHGAAPVAFAMNRVLMAPQII